MSYQFTFLYPLKNKKYDLQMFTRGIEIQHWEKNRLTSQRHQERVSENISAFNTVWNFNFETLTLHCLDKYFETEELRVIRFWIKKSDYIFDLRKVVQKKKLFFNLGRILTYKTCRALQVSYYVFPFHLVQPNKCQCFPHIETS